MLKIKIFPRIKIHCWGGLGSQLFTLALALDLDKRYPKRQVTLIFHTSGITRRGLEIDFLPKKIKYEVKNDFKEIKSVRNSKKFLIRKKIIHLLRIFLLKSHFLGEANSNDEFSKIKFWVFSLRGHYSLREISNDTAIIILRLYNASKNLKSNKNPIKSEIALHYRLGDLYYSGAKEYIDVSLISNLIIQVCKTNKVALVDIYSDSMGKALDLLRGIGLPFKLNSAESKSFETIDLLLSYKYFIGTNSKISIWVIIFRICNDRSSINFYPKEIAEQLRINVPTFYQAENLGIYQ